MRMIRNPMTALLMNLKTLLVVIGNTGYLIIQYYTIFNLRIRWMSPHDKNYLRSSKILLKKLFF